MYAGEVVRWGEEKFAVRMSRLAMSRYVAGKGEQQSRVSRWHITP